MRRTRAMAIAAGVLLALCSAAQAQVYAPPPSSLPPLPPQSSRPVLNTYTGPVLRAPEPGDRETREKLLDPSELLPVGKAAEGANAVGNAATLTHNAPGEVIGKGGSVLQVGVDLKNAASAKTLMGGAAHTASACANTLAVASNPAAPCMAVTANVLHKLDGNEEEGNKDIAINAARCAANVTAAVAGCAMGALGGGVGCAPAALEAAAGANKAGEAVEAAWKTGEAAKKLHDNVTCDKKDKSGEPANSGQERANMPAVLSDGDATSATNGNGLQVTFADPNAPAPPAQPIMGGTLPGTRESTAFGQDNTVALAAPSLDTTSGEAGLAAEGGQRRQQRQENSARQARARAQAEEDARSSAASQAQTAAILQGLTGVIQAAAVQQQVSQQRQTAASAPAKKVAAAPKAPEYDCGTAAGRKAYRAAMGYGCNQ